MKDKEKDRGGGTGYGWRENKNKEEVHRPRTKKVKEQGLWRKQENKDGNEEQRRGKGGG